MDADQVATLRALMAGSRWLEQAGLLGRALRTSPRSAGGLLVVGTPDFEPWHVTLRDSVERWAGRLAPTSRPVRVLASAGNSAATPADLESLTVQDEIRWRGEREGLLLY